MTLGTEETCVFEREINNCALIPQILFFFIPFIPVFLFSFLCNRLNLHGLP